MKEQKIVLLTTEQASLRYGMSIAWFNKQRFIGVAPVYLKIGRSVRYRKEDLEQFFMEQEVKPYHLGYCMSVDL